MTAVVRQARVVREPVDATIGRLETLVARMEHRYECKSAAMVKAVRTGQVRETAEVSSWIVNYKTLLALRRKSGHTTGSPTSSIG